jgi:hypothetical protein
MYLYRPFPVAVVVAGIYDTVVMSDDERVGKM